MNIDKVGPPLLGHALSCDTSSFKPRQTVLHMSCKYMCVCRFIEISVKVCVYICCSVLTSTWVPPSSALLHTLHHAATWCNTYCTVLQHTCIPARSRIKHYPSGFATHDATHCNTLQHTATHCNTLQHTAPHCNTLQHTATHCNTLQRTATHCKTLQHAATR